MKGKCWERTENKFTSAIVLMDWAVYHVGCSWEDNGRKVLVDTVRRAGFQVIGR